MKLEVVSCRERLREHVGCHKTGEGAELERVLCGAISKLPARKEHPITDFVFWPNYSTVRAPTAPKLVPTFPMFKETLFDSNDNA